MSAKGYVVTGGGGSGEAHTHPWSDITGEPATYPPSSHTHPDPAWSSVTGKPSTFPPSSHTHAVEEVVDLEGILANLENPAWADITGKPSTFPPDTHTHDYASSGHSHAAPSWTDITGKPSTFTPSAHGHSTSEVTGLDAALTALAVPPAWTDITGKPSTFPPDTHSHTIAQVTSLQAALDGKSATGHGHSIADVTNLQSTLDTKAPLADPAFTGNPTAPTQTAGNNSTRVATTAFVTTAVAAVSGGGGGAGLPDSVYPVSGLWTPFPAGRIGSNRTMEVGRGFFAPLPMAAAGTLDQLALEVVTAGGAGAVIRIVLWTAGSNRIPSVSFRDLGTIASDSTGTKTWTGIAQALTANTLYWVAAIAQTATCVVRATSAYNSYMMDTAAFTGTGETSHLAMFGGLTGAVANGTAFVLEGSENGPRMSARFS